MTPTLDLAALRATAEIQKLSSDKLFAGFERGEEWIDQGDERARELAYGVLALLDRLEAAERTLRNLSRARNFSDVMALIGQALRGSSDSGTGDKHG